MSVETRDPDSRFEDAAAEGPARDAGALEPLPRLASRQARLEERLARLVLDVRSFDLDDLIVAGIAIGHPEILWKAAGLGRPGLVAQLSWPRLSTRLGLGIETPLAHAVVDQMLGYDRFEGQSRLQLSPVEWGILAFLLGRALSRLTGRNGPLGPWDLVIDRAGPDPFDVSGLGPIVTLRWPVRVGNVTGSARLWLPESLVAKWVAADPPPLPDLETSTRARLGELSGTWRALAGTVAMPRGLGKLRAGAVLPPGDIHLVGTPQDPRGEVQLVLDAGRDGRFRLPVDAVPFSGGGRLTVTAPVLWIPSPREALALNPTPSPDPAATTGLAPSDVPVTLVVELGRVNLSLRRLADLKPGDVVELGRHSREPVELTSGGRLVARGELVQIDTELGVRVTNVFL